jgi:PAS domain S-box-containing protein
MRVSLRTYLVMLLLLATVPVVVLMCYQQFEKVRDEQIRLQDDLQRDSKALSHAVEREIAASIDALRVMALASSLRRGDVVDFERAVAGRSPLRPGWRGTFLTDAEGNLLFDTTGAGQRDAEAPVPDLQRMLAQRAPLVTNLVTGGTKGQQDTAIMVPVLIDGELRYGLGVWVPWAAWQEVLHQATAPGLELSTLFDRDRRVIARSAEPERFVGQPVPERQLDGETMYNAWQTVPVAGWGVGVGIRAHPVELAQWRAIGTALATAAACLLLGVTLALLIARRVTVPLTQLAHHGGAGLRRPVYVLEIALLRDALLAAHERDEATRDGLRRKADEFETLFNSTPIGLAFAQDRECANVLHNAAMNHLFGTLEEHASGAQRVFHRGVPLPPDQMPLSVAARTGQAVAMMELEFRSAGMPVIHAIANAVPLRDANGRPRGAIAAMVDITARKEAEARLLSVDSRFRQSQRLVDLAQEAGHVGFFNYQFENDALVWTPGQAKLFGMETSSFESTLGELLGQIHSDDRGLMEMALLRALAAHQDSANFEYRVSFVDASVRWLSTRISLIYRDDGRPQKMVGVTLDITDRKRVEQATAELMEREQSARKQAEAANRAKDEFLAMLGHELRNPLSAISSAVEVLGRREASDSMAKSAREIIARQTRHLSHMMGDLLDVTRVISGKVLLSRAALNLAALVQRTIDTLRLTGEAARHVIDVDLEEAWVEADATRMEQVVTNLVGNALKYTPPGSQISISLRCEGALAVMRVSDNGDGIPSDLLPRIFDLFVQGERTIDRRAGGLGIGLTLVKRLIDLHGGTVTAHSSSDGSRFEVRLPLVNAVAEAPVRPWQAQVAGRRVLVIEDNEDALKSMSDMLALDGHSVSGAKDGTLGLSTLLEQRPDVAVVDIGLPGIDGFQVALRARAGGYAGRMIAVSGYGQEQDARRALKSGFDAHMVKPVGPDELRRMLGAQ